MSALRFAPLRKRRLGDVETVQEDSEPRKGLMEDDVAISMRNPFQVWTTLSKESYRGFKTEFNNVATNSTYKIEFRHFIDKEVYNTLRYRFQHSDLDIDTISNEEFFTINGSRIILEP